MKNKRIIKQKLPKSSNKPEEPFWKNFSDDPDEFRMDMALHTLRKLNEEKKKRLRK